MARLPPNATHPKTRAAWRQWLESHHTQATGVWLVSYKKASGKARFEYEESVEEALCFGWIDSIVKKIDAESFAQRFSPRRARSRSACSPA